VDGNGGVSRVFCFHGRYSYFFLFLLGRALLDNGLSAQRSKILGVLVLVLLGDAAFLSWTFSLAPVFEHSKRKSKTAKLFPLLHNLRMLRGFAATCIWLFICPFTSFLLCYVVDIGLLLW
jgi:hypothetical protein